MSIQPCISYYNQLYFAKWQPTYKNTKAKAEQLILRAGLTIVPVVPWEGAPRRQGAPINCQILYYAVLTLRRLNGKCRLKRNVSTTIKKRRQLFGRRKVHIERENYGYMHEQRAPPLTLVWAPEWLIRPCK